MQEVCSCLIKLKKSSFVGYFLQPQHTVEFTDRKLIERIKLTVFSINYKNIFIKFHIHITTHIYISFKYKKIELKKKNPCRVKNQESIDLPGLIINSPHGPTPPKKRH